MKCQHKKCENDAICAVELNIPAKGYPAIPSKCARITINLVVCHKHFTEMKAGEFLDINPDIKKIVTLTLKDRTPPDFDRAFITAAPLTGEALGILKRLEKEHKDG